MRVLETEEEATPPDQRCPFPSRDSVVHGIHSGLRSPWACPRRAGLGWGCGHSKRDRE